MNISKKTASSQQTIRLGFYLARQILKDRLGKKALVVALVGELGSGKTTFLQGFAKGLGIKEKILSPTFVILKKFQPPSSKFQALYHIDCYRIKKPKEILRLGFKEIISNPKNIVVVEWANKIKKIIPASTFWIEFRFFSKNTREIELKFPGHRLFNL